MLLLNKDLQKSDIMPWAYRLFSNLDKKIKVMEFSKTADL